MKKIIAVDADDTLFDENNAIRNFINKNYGFNHSEGDYLVTGLFGSYWEQIWEVDPAQGQTMYDAFITSSAKQNLEPFQDALRVLQALKQKYELVVVTSRDSRVVQWTHDGLAKHYPEVFKDVHFTPLWGGGKNVTKAMICKSIGASILIDDFIGHCQLAAEAGVKAILYGDYGWSRVENLPDGVVRCKDWQAVETELLG